MACPPTKARPRPGLAAALRVALAALMAAATVGPSPAQPSSGGPVLIPVRVFSGGAFRPDLGRTDFTVVEDLDRRPVEGLALVEGNRIVRSEGLAGPPPSLRRNFYLWFYVTNFEPKLQEAVDHVVRTEILPGDTLTVITPMRTYTLNGEALAAKTPGDLERETRKMLREDILRGNMEYKGLIRELRGISQSLRTNLGGGAGDIAGEDSDATGFGIDVNLGRYRTALQRIEVLRRLDGRRLLAFASHLREQPGRSHVVLFYEREYKPDVESRLLNMAVSEFQDSPQVGQELNDLFMTYMRDTPLEARPVARAFSDSNSTLSVILTDERAARDALVTMTEKSEDLYSAFREICAATGGVFEGAANPSAGVRAVAEAIGRYYLLLYTPAAEAAPAGAPARTSAGTPARTSAGQPAGPKFRALSVRVNRPGCEVFHRLGYFR